jgi:hypothetical protein
MIKDDAWAMKKKHNPKNIQKYRSPFRRREWSGHFEWTVLLVPQTLKLLCIRIETM